ncbi:PEGA domain-containing protein [Patescibacteria group bacterium]
MDVKKRRIYYLTISIIFIVLTPIIILFTTGYRFSLVTFSIYKTGVLIVDSSPAGAKVTINSENTEKTTPSRFADLHPGSYDLVLTKDNYRPWQTNFQIYTEQSTIIDSPLLIKKNFDNQNISADVVTSFWPAPNQQFLAYLESGQDSVLQIINIDNNNQQDITIGKKIISAKWSDDSNKILIKTGEGQYSVVDRANNDITTLPALSQLSFSEVYWLNGVNLIAQTSKQLYLIKLADRSINIIRSDNIISSIKASSDQLWTLTDKTSLELISTNGDTIEEYALANDDYNFIENSINHHIGLISNTKPLMLLLDGQQLLNINLTFIPRTTAWNKNRSAFFLASENEIWVASSSHDYELNLLERTSANIAEINWFNNYHLLYKQKKGVYLIDTDSETQLQKEKLLSQALEADIIMTTENDVIYYSASQGLNRIKIT